VHGASGFTFWLPDDWTAKEGENGLLEAEGNGMTMFFTVSDPVLDEEMTVFRTR
jgi:hypothetical protein